MEDRTNMISDFYPTLFYSQQSTTIRARRARLSCAAVARANEQSINLSKDGLYILETTNSQSSTTGPRTRIQTKKSCTTIPERGPLDLYLWTLDRQ